MLMVHASTKREALDVGNIREGPFCQTKAPCFFYVFAQKMLIELHNLTWPQIFLGRSI